VNGERDDALDGACACSTCTTFSRSYLYHLFKCSEPLGPRLLSVHNLHYYVDLMRRARAAIDAGVYAAFARETLARIDRHEHAEAAP
jgi:queuine tRNA-ribosyltransferase